ncbi:hypothetical protein Bca52824_086577 [Brassica carinata]|uniref:Uncharacterized protein n=1 Tax=Brassica carinata TaxID=52824 RepID=A0A8X7P6I8_BRACI|nr:hypothetical protein Bca52824_086577 [Brassica carinata]
MSQSQLIGSSGEMKNGEGWGRKREYQGKGKGKMYEETDSKWVRAADRSINFTVTKPKKWPPWRGGKLSSQELRREQISKGRTEGKEEGEIKEKELERSKHKRAKKVQDQAQPSQAFLAELMETQENYLRRLRLRISRKRSIWRIWKGNTGYWGGGEEAEHTKKAVKPSLGAAASNKLKMAQLVAAKRTVAKPGIRHGDYSKQGEEKGTSGPRHDPAKQAKDP